MLEINPESVEDKLIKKFLKFNPDVQLAAIISTKGFPIAINFTQDIDKELISPMFAAIHSVSEMFMNECFNGSLNHVLLEAKKNNIFVRKIGSERLLCLISDNKDFLKFNFPKDLGKTLL